MNDSEDPNDEVQYHLEVGPANLADAVLFPGNPGRVDKATALWDDHEGKASHHEYRTVTGSYDGTPVSITSVGIGSPSAAITVKELARVGADTFIRVGSCGAIQLEMDVGNLVVTSGAVRQEGTFKEYVREDYPAVADHEVVSALIAAAERFGYDYHVGLTISADSFYAGQGCPSFEGLRAAGSDSLVEELCETNIKNIEMKAAALLIIANVYGLRTGAVCSVYANRITGEFRTEDESYAAETTSLTAHLPAKTDEVKREAGVDRRHAGLSLD